MNPEFEQKLNRKLAAFDAWANVSTFRECKLVQYCGVDLVGVIDVETDQIVDQITGLLCEGFYVDWKQNGSILYLRVYEFGGAGADVGASGERRAISGYRRNP
ncbi:hypothetical protein MZ018_16545 [Shewanella sp. JNE10-2]|uniref:hypothetical protein n=1 Tax=unclassified Shewanella TaxID=196818 RepID=UPI00200442E3|nr:MULTISPECIES: hypothetical protein [unclassified Shewanella]MCK7629496.1 hypothetical protein [Shewanella sp. JNE9-1]MCK7644666.1 hypothetical protein [Shewanella sp. JNE3-1]MCK7652799.1 hypothetical protein [Shewanella sp. JNE4-1]UPO26491.1 hypothetical protein MZ018_16545 [Shewanella sp. JNE10-2]UPO33688.1 hypothetical protein MZ097_11465 [Shewanella sp. JNE7]